MGDTPRAPRPAALFENREVGETPRAPRPAALFENREVGGTPPEPAGRRRCLGEDTPELPGLRRCLGGYPPIPPQAGGLPYFWPNGNQVAASLASAWALAGVPLAVGRLGL